MDVHFGRLLACAKSPCVWKVSPHNGQMFIHEIHNKESCILILVIRYVYFEFDRNLSHVTVHKIFDLKK